MDPGRNHEAEKSGHIVAPEPLQHLGFLTVRFLVPGGDPAVAGDHRDLPVIVT